MSVGWQILSSAAPIFLLGLGFGAMVETDWPRLRLWWLARAACFWVGGLCLIVGLLMVIWS